jgi:hypothetical protein
MVRNLLLSFTMHRPIAEQEASYYRLWLQPLETRYRRPAAMDALLSAYLDSLASSRGGGGAVRPSKFEQEVAAIVQQA